MVWIGSEACERERAGSNINVKEWSFDCGPEMAELCINVVEWSVDCGPDMAGHRIVHSDARAHAYKVK